MPESKGRSKPAYTPPRSAKKDPGPNARWFVPVMLGLMVAGLLWVVTYYLTAGQFPVAAWHNWNLGIGFAFMISGFLMTTRWR